MGLTKDLGALPRVLTVSGSNVGVGKEIPNSRLDINGNTLITGSLAVTQGITGSLLGTATTASFVNIGGLGGFVQGGNSFGAQALIGTNDNQSLALETSGNIRMFVSSSGNVGVGTVTPTQRLDVAGTIQTNGYLFFTTPNSSIGAGTSNSSWLEANTNTAFNLRINGGDRFIVNSSGNVGIGTTSPAERLDVRGRVFINGTDTRIYIDNGGVGGSSLLLGVVGTSHGYIGTDGPFPIIFQPNNTERMRITSGGNVGIGTANATGQSSDNRALQIYGAGFANRAQIHFVNANTGEGTSDGTFIGIDSNKDFFLINTEGNTVFENNGSERMRITSGGNVGIGTTSPTGRLTIRGVDAGCTIDMFNTGISQNYRIVVNTSTGALAFENNSGNETIRFNQNGNIGIGTSTPGFKLDVNGTGRFSSNLTARNFNNAIKSWSANGAYNWATELLALSGFFDNAGWYKGFIRESNGAHYYGYQFDIHVGQLGYGGASNQFIVRNMTYAGGPWVGGCGVSSFASIDNSGFTKQSSGCFDSLELFITRLG